MPRSVPIASFDASTGLFVCPRTTNATDKSAGELPQYTLWIISVRAVILLLGLNLAEPLKLLPSKVGSMPFLPFCNILVLALTIGYLALWWGYERHRIQLYGQIGLDILLVTLLVASTRGWESAFVSFYLLIIMYSSLTLGREGGMLASALSTIAYAAVIACGQAGLIPSSASDPATRAVPYRVALHSLGFFTVAFLGTYLSMRLHAVQEQLENKIDSLQQLQKLNEHIVTSIRSGLITTDLAGSVAVFNAAAEELTERRRADVLHAQVDSLFGGELWSRIVKSDLFQNARPLRHEQSIELPDGSARYLGFSVSPLLDHKQDVLGYIISFQDLTEIKRLERQVLLKDRMAAIGRMAAGIAHEIRNPLTSMRGSVEILRSRANLAASDQRLLDILMRESDRLNNFVADFLRFAKPANHNHGPLDLCPILRDAVTLFQNSPEVRTKYSITLELESQRIPISGNADQMQQVFWNLAQNALRAMPAGGALQIRAGADQKGAQVVFTDGGIGMTRDERDQLFQPFQSGFAGGVGLGLSIIYEIMEEHRGEIAIDSERGQGTTVTLRFPPTDEIE